MHSPCASFEITSLLNATYVAIGTFYVLALVYSGARCYINCTVILESKFLSVMSDASPPISIPSPHIPEVEEEVILRMTSSFRTTWLVEVTGRI